VAKSLRRDDGSGQAANPGAAREGLRFPRLAGQSLSDPIKQRPTAPTADRSKTPAIWTELRKEGLTPGGPLQKPGNLTLGDVGLLTDAAPTSVDERPGFGRFEDSKRQCRSSAAGVAARSGVYVASALSGSCQIAVFLSLACAKLNSC
jgi:hypothetical protein